MFEFIINHLQMLIIKKQELINDNIIPQFVKDENIKQIVECKNAINILKNQTYV